MHHTAKKKLQPLDFLLMSAYVIIKAEMNARTIFPSDENISGGHNVCYYDITISNVLLVFSTFLVSVPFSYRMPRDPRREKNQVRVQCRRARLHSSSHFRALNASSTHLTTLKSEATWNDVFSMLRSFLLLLLYFTLDWNFDRDGIVCLSREIIKAGFWEGWKNCSTN